MTVQLNVRQLRLDTWPIRSKKEEEEKRQSERERVNERARAHTHKHNRTQKALSKATTQFTFISFYIFAACVPFSIFNV